MIKISIIDGMNVRIGADASGLKRELKDVKNNVSGLSSSVSGFGNTATKAMDGFKSSVSGATQPLGGLQSQIKKIGAVIGAAFAGQKLIEFGKDAIDAASDLTEVQNVVDTVFGSMSGDINSWSKSAMTAFGLSETKAKQFTSTMGAMLKSSGITGNSLKTMSINMAALSADMASFYNLDSTTAFEKIRSGISGETEPLKQLGINMSVANMEAYAMAQGISKSYSEMSQAEQTMLRYNYLLSVTKDAQHDFSRTSDSWANQVKVLSEQFAKLKTEIGQNLIKALTPLLQLFNKLIAKLVEYAQTFSAVFGGGSESNDASSGMSGIADSAGDAADNLKEADKAAKKLNNTILGFDELHIMSDDNSSSADTDKIDMSKLMPNNVYSYMKDGISGVSDEVMAQLEKIKEKLQPVFDLVKTIKESFQTAFESDEAQQFVENLKANFDTLLDVIASIAEAIGTAWTSGDAGTTMIMSWISAISQVSNLINVLGQSLAAAFKSDAGTAYFQSLINLSKATADVIGGFSAGLAAAWNDGGAGEMYWESLLQKEASVNDAISAVGESIANAFNSDVGVAMFGQLIELGTNLNEIVSVIAQSFTDAWNNAGLGQEIIDSIALILTSIVEQINNWANGFINAWNNAGLGENILTGIGEIISNVLGFITEIGELWNSIFDEEVTTAFWTSILESVQNVLQFIGDITNGIIEAFENTGALSEIFAVVKDIVENVLNVLHDITQALADSFGSIDWEPIVSALAGIVTSLGDVFNRIVDIIGTTIVDLIPIIADGLQIVLDVATLIINAASDILELLMPLVDVLGELIESLMPVLNDLLGECSGVTENIGEFLDAVIQCLSPIVECIVQLIKDCMPILNEALEVLIGLLDPLSELAASIMKALTPIIEAVKTFAESLWSELEPIIEELNPLLSDIGELIGAILECLEPIFELIGKIIEKLAESAFKNIIESVKKLLEAVSPFIGILKGIIEILTDIMDWVKSVIQWFNKLFETKGTVTVNTVTTSSQSLDSSIDVADVSPVNITGYATGGMPKGGELFMAREDGKNEFVGSYGTQSVVANNEQIVSAVSSGVANAIKPLLESVAGGSEQTVKIRGTDLLIISKRAEKQRGTTISNNFAFGGV